MKGGDDHYIAASGKNIRQVRPSNDSPEAYGSDYESTKRAVIFGAKDSKQRGHTSMQTS